MALSGPSPFLFPSEENPDGYQKTFKTVWHATLRRAKVRYFRIYDLRSTYATRLSAGGVADEWVTQLLRQGDAKVFKKYSQMKLGSFAAVGQPIHKHDPPSFDCAKAAAAIEVLICKDVELSFLDSQMANSYKLALKDASGERKEVRHPPQSGWLDELGRLKGGRPWV